MVNIVFLLGRIGHDIEIKYMQNGNSVVNFNLATSNYYNGKEYVEWHKVVAFGKTAENINKHLGKGSLVYIEGKLRTRSYEDRNGETKYVTEVVVDKIKFLDKKKGNVKEDDFNNDDIPF